MRKRPSCAAMAPATTSLTKMPCTFVCLMLVLQEFKEKSKARTQSKVSQTNSFSLLHMCTAPTGFGLRCAVPSFR